ncbi:MAG: hypothetical protein DRP06_04495 [Candidatus Aenigmatarchaeota archaeon]|nr:MAG: hypothetical protein DRP06_04495 [Candidatus Aenigmarchaeota archaeon]
MLPSQEKLNFGKGQRSGVQLRFSLEKENFKQKKGKIHICPLKISPSPFTKNRLYDDGNNNRCKNSITSTKERNMDLILVKGGTTTSTYKAFEASVPDKGKPSESITVPVRTAVDM